MNWTRKDLVGLEDLSKEEIITILDTAAVFKPFAKLNNKQRQDLKGKTTLLFFYEASTRTATSFALASSRLGAGNIKFSKATSSAQKGESLVDTAKNIQAMGIDFVVIRHSMHGAAKLLSEIMPECIINAGDGAHEHPTQGLLDIYTIREKLGKVGGLKVAIVGDIAHSRVARSNIWGLQKLGAEVHLVAPMTLMPVEIEKMGVTVHDGLDEILPALDVVNMLRIQRERMDTQYFPSTRDYVARFGLNEERLRKAKSDILILHPGPVNRGVEITPELADCTKSAILEQVTNGLAVRMAVLTLLNSARSS